MPEAVPGTVGEDFRRGARDGFAKGRIGLLRRRRLVGHPGSVCDGYRVDRVAGAALFFPRADAQHQSGLLARRHDGVSGPRWAMNEVPRAQRTLLAFDDQRAIAGENEEVLLPSLVVIKRHRASWLQPEQAHSEVIKMRRTLATKAAPRPHAIVK